MNLIVLLDENCFYLVLLDLVLEGIFGCLQLEDIVINVDNSGELVVYGSGVYEFDIYIEGVYFCIGIIILMDNILLMIICLSIIVDFICSDID